MTVRSTLKTAPGVRHWIPLPFGDVNRVRRDPLGFLLEGFRQHGDVFRYQLGPLAFHLVAHPDHVKHVLVDNHKNYPRSRLYERAKIGAGEGLVTTEGPVWRRLRRMSQPAFHHRRIESFAEVMVEIIDAMRRRWRERIVAGTSEPVDLAREFMELTLRIVGRTLVNVDLGGEADRIGPAITTALAYVEHRLANLLSLPPSVPTPRALRFRRAMRVLDGIVYDLIAQHRREPENQTNDLLALLLAVRDEQTGEGLTDLELRDQIFTFIVAGHETTAVALTWTFHLLDRHPEAWERLRAEVVETLGDRPPTFTDLSRLTYARRVVEESLRLYPPVYAVGRDAVENDEIGGFVIPRKARVILSPYVTHRHPDFWPDPERFDPDRFTPERSAGRPKLAWYPFLGGPHQCIGQEFAMMEAILAVVMIVQQFRLEAVPGFRVTSQPLLSLRPRDGLPMFIRPE